MRWNICYCMLLVLSLACSCLLSSCSSTRRIEPVVVERVSHDTLYKVLNTVQRDTISVRDSVYFASDGVLSRERTIYRVKYLRCSDTIFRTRTDTVPKVVKVREVVEKEIPAKVAWWQRMLMWIGGLCFASTAVLAVIMVRQSR